MKCNRKTILLMSSLFLPLVLVSPAVEQTTAQAGLLPRLVPGMLPVGEYPLEVFDIGQSFRYRSSDAHAPSVVVQGSSELQTQTFNIAPGVVEVTLESSSPGLAEGVYLKELELQGLRFVPERPVLYRPLNLAGILVPLQRWDWTVDSVSGGVALSQSSIVQLPSLELVDGAPVLVQRIDTTLTFSGNAVGAVALTHWEEVGNRTRMREHYKGRITAFNRPGFAGTTFAQAAVGGTDTVDTVIVMGGLGGPAS